ncbi:DMT family transporter [Oceanimonas sp. CHS3-5]|uniref:DMT family transporter n=1 Tax=Oceanimonas sp. CHS3-5 TaxID=3068186 RepID=UPI00273F43EA|nr:DMT family transporter [Oceanimonas sp. CHS3-5]MDP5290929.1 DMT family transporter [Oceanimonas sp. CHS3-5]
MSPYHKGVLLTLAGVTVLSLDALLIRLIGADHWSLLFWRGLLLSLSVGVLCRPKTRLPRRLMLGSALCYAATTITFVLAVRLTSVANTLIILAAAPLVGALLSRILLKEQITLRTWLAMALCMAGLMMVMSGSGDSNLAGDSAALLCAASLGGKLVCDRAARPANMAPALVPAGLIIALVGFTQAPVLTVPAADALWLGLLGLGVVPLAYVLISQGPRYLPAAEVGLLLLLEMLLGPLWVWLILNEPPGQEAILGGLVVLTALLLPRLPMPRRWRQAVPAGS